MRILITGGLGQLGNELSRCISTGRAEIGPIPASYADADVTCIDYHELDISDEAAVDAWFKNYGPYDLVVNSAAITNVDGCEKDEEGAHRVNADAVGYLARGAEGCGAKFVHISTDYVFPGTDPVPRTEDDQTGPISAYGRTKLDGEKEAFANCSRTFVLRTAWLYGYVGKNFVKTMVGLGTKLDHVTVVDDQLGNPTSANDLAYEILALADTEYYGLYHCTNEGTCSWADFTEAIMEGADRDCAVVRCSSAEYKENNPQSADRPAYSSLENRHLAQTIGNKMRPWQEALSTYLANMPALAKNPSWDDLTQPAK